MTEAIETQFFVEMNLIIVLMRITLILLHYVELPPKPLTRHKFLKGAFSKRKQRKSRNSQKLGQKAIKDLEHVCLNPAQISSLFCCS